MTSGTGSPRVSATAVRDWAALVLLAAALCVCAFYLTASVAPLTPDNGRTFMAPQFAAARGIELRQEWRPRVLSVGVADLLARRLWSAGVRPPELHLMVTVGSYSAIWIALCSVVLLWGFGKRAIVLMWGVLAAVTFAYCPGVATRVYPWDMPALFFFSAFVALYHRGMYRALPVVILAGLPFKETTGVLCLAFLFLDIPIRERLRYLIVTAVLFAGLKVAIDVAVHNPVPFFSMTSRTPNEGTLRLVENLRAIARPQIAHPVLINAGMLVALALVPGRGRAVWMVRWVAAAFAVNTLLFAMIEEYRIWLELAPLAAWVLAERFVWGTGAEHGPGRGSARRAGQASPA
jgi:hypothetical protein